MIDNVDLAELEHYLRIFQENPHSRVFAPLADMYRRLGRLKEAEEICREGLERNPYYAGGRVALAHIYLDTNRFDLARKEANAVVTYYPDNLLARKILIRALAYAGEYESATKEFEILKAMAPDVVEDSDLREALISRKPALRQYADELTKESVKNKQGHNDATRNNHAELSQNSSDIRRIRLLRKQTILKAWIDRLGSRGPFG